MRAELPRVAANDPQLAHGLAARSLASGELDLRALLPRLSRRSLRQGAALLRDRFPGGILMESVQRECGSRAAGRWAVLAPMGGKLSLWKIVFDARQRFLAGGHWSVHPAGVEISRHAAARIAQRRTHVAELGALAAAAGPHALAMAAWLLDHVLPSGMHGLAIDAAGATIWRPASNGVFATTYLGIETTTNPTILRLAEAAQDGNLRLLVREAQADA